MSVFLFLPVLKPDNHDRSVVNLRQKVKPNNTVDIIRVVIRWMAQHS